MPERTPITKDLLASPRSRLLWWLPWVLILIGCFLGDVVRTVLWTVGFSLAGALCIVNAWRCGRRYCLYTGPLYMLAALTALLYGLHVLPFGQYGWGWILAVTVAGGLFALYVLEKMYGKYTGTQPPQA